MMSIVIVLGVVLVLAILYMIFRISSLIGVMKGSEDRADSYNKVNAVLFMVFSVVSIVGFLWYSFAHFDGYTLPVASEHGKITDHLFWITMAITVFAFVIISIVMFWFTYKYQYDPKRRAEFIPDNHKLEIIWTIVPAIVLALLIFRGLRVWNEITGPAKPDAEVIELIAKQFDWTARYPGADKVLGSVNYRMIDGSNDMGLNLGDDKSFDDFKSLVLHVPVGKEVLLKIRAKDVLHSVYLPHFRLKMDAVPGMMTQFKFVATKTTQQMRDELGNPKFNYEMACAEICGRGHFAMKFPVIVDEPEDYEKWKVQQEAWLKQNPDYMDKVPEALRESAKLKAGLGTETAAVTTASTK